MSTAIASIEKAIMKHRITSEVDLGSYYKRYLRDRDAFYFFLNAGNELTGVYLKKEMFFWWNVRMKLIFTGIDYAEKRFDPVTCNVVNLWKTSLVQCLYDRSTFNSVKVNGSEIEKLEISGSSKIFGFILMDKNNRKFIEGFNSEGVCTYQQEYQGEEIKMA